MKLYKPGPGAQRAAFIALVGTVLFTVPAAAQQRLGYSLDPTATFVNWDDALPLEDHWFYGGRFSLRFGPQVELQPFFMRGSKVGVDSSRGPAVFGTAPLSRTLRIDHMGATIQLNFGQGDVVPFVRAGGGVLRFEPDSGDITRRISILAAGGLRVNLGGIRGELFAEQFRFRMFPSRLFRGDTVLSPTSGRAPVLENTNYGAAVSIPLSTFSDDVNPQGLRGAQAPIEPFVGRLYFHDDLGLADQELVGIRAGADFGPLLGLRGFFWRGINADYDGTDPISGYGGEAQFNLNSGSGLSPYLVTGAGRIDFSPSYRDTAGNERSDQTALILGAGVSFALTERVRVNLALRDYITTTDEEFEAARDPGDLLHSRQFTAGFTFALGGRSARSPAPASRTGRDAEPRAVAMTPTEPRKAAEAAARDTAPTRRVVVESLVVAAPAAVDTTSRRIVIPAPTVGEIIIRYGTQGETVAMRAPQIVPMDTARRTVVREVDTLRVAAVPSTGDISPEVAALRDRLASLERELAQQRRDLEIARMQPGVEVIRLPDSSTAVTTGAGRSFSSRVAAIRPADLTPFLGVEGGDGTKVIISARADLGPVTPGSSFHLVPELAFGRGDGRTTLLAMANLRYPLGSFGRVAPYVMGGIGLYSRSVLAVGTSLGTAINLRQPGQTPLYGFVELQGLNLFNQTRLLVGLGGHR